MPGLRWLYSAFPFPYKKLMKISEFLKKDYVLYNLSAREKKDALEELSGFLQSQKVVHSQENLLKALLEREGLGSTGIGENVAIPHAKSEQIKSIVALFARSKEGVNFDSLDQKPVHLICLLIAPKNSTGLHLKALARIAKLLKNENLRESILNAASAGDIYTLLIEEDNKLG